MRKSYFGQKIIAAIILFFSMFSVLQAQAVRTDLSEIELLTDHSSIAAGDTFNVVIKMSPDDGWHGYWENPGDAGLRINMNWQLPEGFEVGELKFRTPHLIPYEEIVTYGYESDVTVYTEIKVPAGFEAGEVTLAGDAFWLICSDSLCVPQDAKIQTNIQIGDTVPDQEISALIDEIKADMPVSANWESKFHTDGENFTIKSKIPNEFPVIEKAYLFPHSEGMMENIYYQNLIFVDGEIIGRFKNAYGYEDNNEFNFVLTFKTGEGQDHAFFLSADKSIEPIAPVLAPAVEESGEMASTPSTSTEMTLLTAMVFAFLGGLILNLMPCVFPILSLKAMSVVELSKKDASEVRLSGLLYTAGILSCFVAIGAVVTALSLGWGFHLQLPLVNFSLGLLMVVIALNLFGIFEFGSNIVGVGQQLTQADQNDKAASRRSTFFTGLLAVVVATPCTAPFMASALGFAFVSNSITSMLVFIALGFGLAFPYLLICYIPAFRNMMPRPGAWMETMRNILGFPMLATALWLFWILGNQSGVDAMTLAVLAGIMLAFGIWVFAKNGIIWKVISVLAFSTILYSGYQITKLKPVQYNQIAEGEAVVDFNSDELAKKVGAGESLFVYFTADWCVTCKLNERVALSQPSVQKAFEDRGITVMKADWTNQNPDITKTLQKYGRIGVPLYLYFPSGSSVDNPDFLPQILTPEIVIEAL